MCNKYQVTQYYVNLQYIAHYQLPVCKLLPKTHYSFELCFKKIQSCEIYNNVYINQAYFNCAIISNMIALIMQYI